MNQKIDYKKETLKAIDEIIYKYENIDWGDFKEQYFKSSSCPLCKIFYDPFGVLNLCNGCFMANKDKSEGCFAFNSFREAMGIWRIYLEWNPGKNKVILAFRKRASFFKKVIPILRELPEKRFNPKYWKYFKEIDRGW